MLIVQKKIDIGIHSDIYKLFLLKLYWTLYFDCDLSEILTFIQGHRGTRKQILRLLSDKVLITLNEFLRNLVCCWDWLEEHQTHFVVSNLHWRGRTPLRQFCVIKRQPTPPKKKRIKSLTLAWVWTCKDHFLSNLFDDKHHLTPQFDMSLNDLHICLRKLLSLCSFYSKFVDRFEWNLICCWDVLVSWRSYIQTKVILHCLCIQHRNRYAQFRYAVEVVWFVQ